jgi:uncharacterized protein
LKHQRRDGYWRHGSICENWADVACPVMAVSGWADGYSNAVFRMLQRLPGPKLGLIGPWSHKYPHQGVPGPAIGFLQECLRWWDHWLADVDTGIMNEPSLRVWMQDSVPPTTYYHERPGRWVGEPSWPSPNIDEEILYLGWPGRLEPDRHASDVEMSISSPLSVGLFAGKWCSYAATPDLPHDQREEDGGALVFNGHPLDRSVEILGAPVVELELESDRPVATVAVRLSDVAPDDRATRVTYGLLNLTHRDSSSTPTPLAPGRTYRVRVSLNHIAHAFPAGHRLRLSLSTSYWPLAWPPPEPVRLTIRMGSSRLVLPVRTARQDDQCIRFGPPEGASPAEVRRVHEGHHNWMVIRDLAEDRSTLEVIDDDGTVYYPEIDLELRRKAHEWYGYVGDDYTSPRGETHWVRGLRRGDWRVSTSSRTILTATATHFTIHARLDAYEGDIRVHSNNWNVSIPRDLG